MKFFCGKNKGSISVFLTLILVPVLIFSGIIVDASRLFASKTVVSGAGDLTMNTALSQYDKKLKDSYGLMSMAKKPESDEVMSVLEKTFQESCSAQYLQKEYQDQFQAAIQLELEDGGLTAKGVKNSSLAYPQILQQQILEYMKYRAPVYMVSDILEKFQKLPLKNMEQKKEYVKKKTKYGKEVSNLGKPLKDAKKYVDDSIKAISTIGNAADNDIANAFIKLKEQSSFWLAARSLENYLYMYTLAPMGEDPIPVERVQENLSCLKVWEQEQNSFDDSFYSDLIAAVSIYQLDQMDSIASYMTEEYGFTQSDIEAFYSVEDVIRKSIDNMDKIYNSAVKEYKKSLKIYEDEAQNIIESSQKAVDALNNLINKWENKVIPAKESYEETRDELINLGEEIDDQDEDQEMLINRNEVEDLIGCLQNNQQAAQNFQENVKTLKSIPDTLNGETVDGDEGEMILDMGHQAAVEQYWMKHQIFPDSLESASMSFQDASQTEFYLDTLNKIEADSSESVQDEDSKKEADNAQDEYQNLMNALESLADEKNLRNYEKFSYPEDFPSGIQKNTADISGNNKQNRINTDRNEIDEITESEGFNSGLDRLLNGLDRISGELLERAYLMEYMTEMFNCLTTENGEKSLSGNDMSSHYIKNGEIEYLLYGNSDTLVNKTFAVSTLYGLRLAINSIYAFMDLDINRTASTLAAAISTGTGQPWLYSAIKYTYLFCQAIIFSTQDILKLSSGEDVPVWRSNDNVKLNYKEYMKLFILISLTENSNESKLVSRTGDCIQLNVEENLQDKYTMLTLEAKVDSSVTFLPGVPAFLGKNQDPGDGKKRIQYKSVMAY